MRRRQARPPSCVRRWRISGRCACVEQRFSQTYQYTTMINLAILRSLASVLLLLFVDGCDLGVPGSELHDTPQSNPREIESSGFLITFAVTDTLEQFTTTLGAGEHFYVHLSITNQTGYDQVYYHSGPIAFLEIWQGDSLVISNVYGLAWPAVVLRDTIGHQQTLTFRWRAPNPVVPWHRVYLNPGLYSAKASIHTLFGGREVPDPMPIEFTVTD